jgi:hypothetical protein
MKDTTCDFTPSVGPARCACDIGPFVVNSANGDFTATGELNYWVRIIILKSDLD